MKPILIIVILILIWSGLSSQTINLPAYKQGQYEIDSIYGYYGPLPLTGMGSVDFGGTLDSNFISGVDFKMVVDSVNLGGSYFHTAYIDSNGLYVAMYAGDTLDIPASFLIIEGSVGFHIIIEGTPLIVGESYLCDLKYEFITGPHWGILILEDSQDSCLVETILGINDNIDLQNVKIYPNPFNQYTVIEYENLTGEPYDLTIFDVQGNQIRAINHINTNRIRIEKDNLPKGIYFFQMQNQRKIIAKGKLIIE